MTHLGNELPPDIIAAQQAQGQAGAVLRHLDSLSSTLRRFVRGDVMSAPERATLESLGITLADAVETLTQAHPNPDFVSRSDLDYIQTATVAQEVLSNEERELLIGCGLGHLVCVPPLQKMTQRKRHQGSWSIYTSDNSTYPTNASF